jgi:hypothetical protein
MSLITQVTSVLKRALQYRPDSGYDAIIDLVGGTELIPHLNTLLEAAHVTIVGDKASRHLGGAVIYHIFQRWFYVLLWDTLAMVGNIIVLSCEEGVFAR